VPDTDVADLVRRAAGGDEGAYRGLVERFTPLVWAIARNHGLGPDVAADVCQTTWLRLVERLDRIEQPGRVGAWLATTARHECLGLLRRRGRSVPVDATSFERDLGSAVTATDPVDDERLARDERRVALLAAWADLPERCRRLLGRLHADPPPAYEELASELAMPIGSIGPTRQRCLAKLRSHEALAGISGEAGASEGVEDRHP
jgi:RNA polymerase sigma factor (sigma-70 family)